jgi:hypothetical protein
MLRSVSFGAALVMAPLAVMAHAVPTHQNITEAAVEYLRKIDDRAVCATNLNQLLQVGTAAEDRDVRPVFHFTPALSALSSTCSSIQWGFGGGVCAVSGLGVIASTTNTHTWAAALAAAKDQNGNASDEGLRQLGYLLHLLEDLTSPAHTRDDDHLTVGGIGDIDPVEAETRQAISPPISEGLLTVSEPIAFFEQLRNFTASNFYSKDTVFNGVGPTAASQDTFYFYDSQSHRIAFKSLAFRAKELFGVTPDPRDATINDVIAAEQFARLGPVAVKHAASFIKHYFDVTGTQPQGCFVDFEKFPGVSSAGGVQPPLKSEGATFSGGFVGKDVAVLYVNTSAVYGTVNFCPGCSSSITIDLATPVNGVRMLLMNGLAFDGTYVIQDDRGGTVTVTLPQNSLDGSSMTTVELPSRGIRRVVVSSNAQYWGFFIDNIVLGIGAQGPSQVRSKLP